MKSNEINKAAGSVHCLSINSNLSTGLYTQPLTRYSNLTLHSKEKKKNKSLRQTDFSVLYIFALLSKTASKCLSYHRTTDFSDITYSILYFCTFVLIIRVFPKVDHSANIARIVLVDQLLIKFLLNIWQRFHKFLVKKYWTYGKYLSNI